VQVKNNGVQEVLPNMG